MLSKAEIVKLIKNAIADNPKKSLELIEDGRLSKLIEFYKSRSVIISDDKIRRLLEKVQAILKSYPTKECDEDFLENEDDELDLELLETVQSGIVAHQGF